MDKKHIVKKVLAKLSKDWEVDPKEFGVKGPYEEHNDWVDSLAQKYKKLTPENAIAYAREWEKYHKFKVPAKPKTETEKVDGEKVIHVQLEGKNWYPVWYDSKMKGLFGEY